MVEINDAIKLDRYKILQLGWKVCVVNTVHCWSFCLARWLASQTRLTAQIHTLLIWIENWLLQEKSRGKANSTVSPFIKPFIIMCAFKHWPKIYFKKNKNNKNQKKTPTLTGSVHSQCMIRVPTHNSANRYSVSLAPLWTCTMWSN